MKLGEAITKQEKALEVLKKTNTNMRKKGLRKGNVESYLKGLEARWEDIRALNADIEKVKTADHNELPYFKGWMEMAEEEFLEQRGLLLEALYEIDATPTNPTEVNNAQMQTRFRKLPQMELPKFSGNYTQWASFKDLFQSMMKDGNLTDVDRLQYLRACLSGDAEQLIKNLPVTAENYNRAWEKLVSQYENTRLIINSCLNSLFQMSPLLKESEQGLSTLKGTTNDVIEILTALKRPVQHWDDVLIYLTVQRLDPKSRRDWETSVANNTTPSTYKELETFLNSRIQALKSIEHQQESLFKTMASTSTSKIPTTKGNLGKASVHNTFQQRTDVECKYCNQGHYIAACNDFKSLDVIARKDFITKARLCYNCLGPHGVRDCRSQKSCYHCKGRHHSLLHSTSNTHASLTDTNGTATPSSMEISLLDTPQDPSGLTANVHTASSNASEKRELILMATALVVVTANGRKALLRALVDPCSDASFIRESVVQLLRIPKRPANISVGGIGGGVSQTVRSQVTVQISSRHHKNFDLSVSALVLSKLTGYLPPRHCITRNFELLEKLELADPQYLSDAPIDLILGLDVYTHIILAGLRKNDTSQVIAQETKLGWILSGCCFDSSKKPAANCHTIVTNEELLCALNKFWEDEEVPSAAEDKFTAEEIACETHYAQTVQRDKDGRYILHLPFNEKIPQLAESYSAAEKMLFRLEKRFASDEEFFRLYSEFIDEYIQLGHAEYVDAAELVGQKTFYLPHHGVLKGSGKEAKIRVVFNGSVKLRGPNINNCLYAGPKLLQELRDVIQRWRWLLYVWTADIIKMFRQILIAAKHQNYILILWRKHPKERIRIIKLRTVTYGLICAPYQALKTLKRLAEDEGRNFPRAKEIVEERSYMDDSYGGANTLEEAKLQQTEFAELLKAGGFRLGKWAANHPQLLEISQDLSPAPSCNIESAEVHSVLGLSWHPASDIFSYKLEWPIEMPENLTKRQVLSQAAKLYDPLGWIAPIIITFKIFLQSLWTMGIQWDDPIAEQRVAEWSRLTKDLADLSQITVPRHIGNSESQAALELHGFADASEKAMAAVLYLRVRGNQKSTCNILIAKTRVAPLKQVSLPRLELTAAFMLAKLVKHQVTVLALNNVSKFLWSDSTVALSWIQGHPTRWTTYVANRVTAIGKAVPDATWSHVSGLLNPADLASRGTNVHGLLSADYWLAGPEFLRNSHEPWRADANFSPLRQCPEERRIAQVTVIDSEWDLLLRYSSLEKLLRVTARCLQFAMRLKIKAKDRALGHPPPALESVRQKEISVLNPEQIMRAEMFWVRLVQTLHFSDEMKALSKGQALNKRSKIIKLHPYIDETGLLRISGHLRNAMLEEDNKHPFILPKDSIFSQLLIQDVHIRTLHGGTQQVLNTLRQRYWIINGRVAVKKIVLSCIVCWKHKPIPSTQLMGDLPAHRVRPARPFLHAGVDYAGPISMRVSRGRGLKSVKGYIVIFICFATRAVHLEVASDYSSDEFVAVYKRFVGRRGISATLYSDCGTNFVGANRQIRELFQQAGTCDKRIAEELIKFRTEWRFNPAGAPHFGGVWEAGVKVAKYHLKRVMGENKLTFEELTTLLTQVEACLNSRPLHPLSDDPTDLSMLTPAHFLVGEPLNLLPEPSLLDVKDGRLSRWQLVRKMTESFWRSWSLNYLQSLQMRNKWTVPKPNIKVGDICRIKVENMLPCRWPLGRIIKIYPGPDKKVRVALIKTSTSTFERPITKVCILPIVDNYSSMIDEGGRNVSN